VTDLENLTIDWQGLEGVYEHIRVDIPSHATSAPWQAVQEYNVSFLVLEQRGLCRLSDETRRMEEERLANVSRKRKPYTRKPGTVHPKTKLKTKRLRAERRWARSPRACLINGYGSWSLDQALWEQLCAPLWKQHDPARLEVTTTAKGTRSDPNTVWNIRILDRKTKAVLYDGNSSYIYHLSSSVPIQDSAVPDSFL
jgi:hypothetical protein